MSIIYQEYEESFSVYGYEEADKIEEILTDIEFRDEICKCLDYWEYVNTNWWRRLSEQILERDLWTCQNCGEPATVVHHLEYPKILGNEDPDDLISLCRKCHAERHGKLHRG